MMTTIKIKLLLYLIFFGALAVAISGGFQVYQFQVYLIQQIKDNLLEAVTDLPKEIDAEAVMKGVNVNFSDNTEFFQNMRFLRSVAKTLKLTRLYTLVPNDSNQFVYSLNASDKFQRDEDFNPESEKPNLQGTIYQDVSPLAIEVWNKGVVKVIDKFDIKKTGTFLSAYNTVKNAQGEKIYLIGAEVKVDEVFARVSTFWVHFYVALSLTLVIAIILALRIGSSLSRPIIRLKDFTMRLANKEFNFELKLPREKNEIYQLYLASQNMAKEIGDYTTHLENLVNQKVSELTNINQELNKRQEEMERDLQLANRIQRNILPNEKSYPRIKEVQFGSVYQSLSAVGGDFFDIIRRGKNQIGLLIADVSGHGVQAALITTMAKVSFNSHSGYNVPTGKVCEKVNQDLIQLLGGEPTHFVTAFYGCFDLETGEFTFTNAGHHAAVLIRHYGREIQRLGKISPFLGMFPQAEFMTESIQLIPGDTILLFTDGIIEAMNSASEIYDEHRLLKYLQVNGGKHSKKLVEGIFEDVRQFCGSQPPNDDQAILLMRYHGNQKLVVEAGSAPSTSNLEDRQKLENAIQLAKEKKYQQSLEIFEEVYLKMPTNPKVVTNYAVILAKVKQFQKAYDILQKAIQVHQDNQELTNMLKSIKTKLDQ